MIPGFGIELGAYAVLAAVVAWLAVSFVRRQRLIGGEKARRKMERADHETADDIRRRVERDRAQRVRDLDGAGYRD